MNDLRLAPFDFNQAVARAGLRPDGQRIQAGVEPTQPGGFQAAMAQALQSVSASQNEARGLQRELLLGNPTVSIEQTMMAMTTAQVGFQATLQVRNRLAQAYSEIMNMQV
jgi:flagellar hook-basal body complex protein FliE